MVNNRVVHGGCGLGKENEVDEAYHKFFGTWSFYSIHYIYMYVCACGRVMRVKTLGAYFSNIP